jgi:hypothetical protein
LEQVEHLGERSFGLVVRKEAGQFLEEGLGHLDLAEVVQLEQDLGKKVSKRV